MIKPLILFIIGGFSYVMIEILWRAYSHASMFIVGGLCFIIIGGINEFYTYEMNLIDQMLISSIIITIIEFIAGCIVNIWLGLNVWDYSSVPFNILGQVCVPYMFLWFLLSFIAIIADDFLRHWLFKEEKPHYNFL